MEHRQTRLLLAMFLVASVLLGLIVFLEPPDPSANPDETVPIWTVTYDEVVAFTLERNGLDRVRVERRDATGWWITEPTPARADPDMVHRVVDALRTIENGVPVEGNPSDFGLADPPNVKVTVETGEGLQKVLWVGVKAPASWKTYVRAEEGRVAAVEGDLPEELRTPARHFRDPRVFRFAPEDVTRIVLNSAGGEISVSRADSGWWVEEFTRADPDAVDDLLAGLLNVRIHTSTDVADAIAAPRFVATVTLEDGTEQSVRVGDETPMGTLMVSPETTGFGTEAELLLLGQGPTDLGDPFAFPFDPERHASVALQLGEHEAVWRAASGGEALADILDNARIRYRRAAVPDVEVPWGRIEIDGRELLVGQEIDGGRVVQDGLGGRPYLVPEDVFEELIAAM